MKFNGRYLNNKEVRHQKPLGRQKVKKEAGELKKRKAKYIPQQIIRREDTSHHFIITVTYLTNVRTGHFHFALAGLLRLLTFFRKIVNFQ